MAFIQENVLGLIVERGVVDTLGIDKTVLEESFATAAHLIEASDTLRSDFGVDFARFTYQPRRPYLQQLVGPTGRLRFTPQSSYDAKGEANPLIKKERDALVKAYNMSPLGSPDEGSIKERYEVLGQIIDNLETTDYLANKVPQFVMDATKGDDGKPYMNSPKLSRWLTRLVGEQSPLTSWYTNSCPKGEAVLGSRDDYELVISTLPHDILGMSYYAPYNWGGNGWIDGWNKTSCMDPIRNGDGDNIYNLPSNVFDETLAVAYLRQVERDYDLERDMEENEEIFNARMLIRVVNINGKHVILGHRVYATNHDERRLIIEGMKVKFDNFIHANDLEKYSGERVEVVYRHQAFNPVKGEYRRMWTPEPYRYDGIEQIVRAHNNGETIDMKNIADYAPYNDNPEVISIYQSKNIFKLPKSFLARQGIEVDSNRIDDEESNSEEKFLAAQAVEVEATPVETIADERQAEAVAFGEDFPF